MFFFLASKALLTSWHPLLLLQEVSFLETLPCGLQVVAAAEAAAAAASFPPTHWVPTASSPLSLLKAGSLLKVTTWHAGCENLSPVLSMTRTIASLNLM